jgi:uncharacterized protein
MEQIDIKKVKASNFEGMIPFSFRKLGDTVVVVNDYGNYLFLSEKEFAHLMEKGPSGVDRAMSAELKAQNMVYTRETAGGVASRLRTRFMDAARVTNLHIIVVTLRCNLKCVYCQANAASCDSYETDMTIDTARKVVDTIFDAPSKMLNFEFQGGEPLLNWETVKFIIEYATEVNLEKKRDLRFNIVSNHLLMDDEKLDFLIKNKVLMCMSLDGPEHIHNKNRGNNYARTIKMYKKVYERYKAEGVVRLPSLLGTLSKHSLGHAREIVDEYRSLGAGSIFMRPATTMGYAGPNWEKIGLTPEEFLAFYEEMLDYIIEINRRGEMFTETYALYVLSKVIAGFEPGYVDMKSPCGASIGQLAYNYNGDVYTCDEGRMLGHQGDHTFRVGKCGESKFSDFIMHRATKACTLSSMLETTPGCSICAYKSYCGICPVINYYETGELTPNVYTTRRHTINEGIIDIIFKRLMDSGTASIFMEWTKNFVESNKLNALVENTGEQEERQETVSTPV